MGRTQLRPDMAALLDPLRRLGKADLVRDFSELP